jgi:choline dehydrogenase
MITRGMRGHSDVIVVGSGSSGAALAARLSDDPSRTVLVLEAGPVHDRVDALPPEVLDARTLPGFPYLWTYRATLTPETSATLLRGRIGGGSSATNGMIFIRGTRADFDRWAAAGNDRWSYDEVLPFFVRTERDLDFGAAAYHGGEGPIPVTRGLGEPLSEMSEAFAHACSELGFAEEADKNAGGDPGWGRVPMSVVDGVRASTAIGYLIPNARRPNLTVQGDSFVRRVVFAGTRAVGVEVERGGAVEVVRGDEIILSAGSLNSPHLLMLSGVGPAAQLRRAGIGVVADRAGVGQGIADHPQSFVTFEATARLAAGHGARMTEVALAATAPGSAVEGDVELIPVPAPFPGPVGRGTEYAIAVNSLHVDDRPGGLTLRSADPHEQPLIDYRYLESAPDRARARAAVRLAAELLRTPAYAPLVRRRASPGDDVLRSDAALDAWLRRSVTTAFHTSASAHMGPAADPTAVVDQHCRVYGTERLRVVDASAFPAPLTRGPAATAIMFGERAAALIEGETP